MIVNTLRIGEKNVRTDTIRVLHKDNHLEVDRCIYVIDEV